MRCHKWMSSVLLAYAVYILFIFFPLKEHGRDFLYLALTLNVLSKVFSTSASDSATSNEFSKTIPESTSGVDKLLSDKVDDK